MSSLPKVLLVDDHPELLEALEGVFEGLPLNVLKAFSGEEALEKFAREPLALLVTDYFMGTMNGWQLIQALRAHQPKLECVLLTASDFRPEPMNPPVTLLRKPLSTGEFQLLQAKVQQVAESGVAVIHPPRN